MSKKQERRLKKKRQKDKVSPKEQFQSVFLFPTIVDKEVLVNLEGKYRQKWSLRLTLAWFLHEEGETLCQAISKIRPDDREGRLATWEYWMTGHLIGKTDKDWRSGNFVGEKFEKILRQAPPSARCQLLERKERVRLLDKNLNGFALLGWWVDQALGKYGLLFEEERQAVLAGRLNGRKRYCQLYQSFLQYLKDTVCMDPEQEIDK